MTNPLAVTMGQAFRYRLTDVLDALATGSRLADPSAAVLGHNTDPTETTVYVRLPRHWTPSRLQKYLWHEWPGCSISVKRLRSELEMYGD